MKQFEADNPEFLKYLMENPVVKDYGYTGKRYYTVLNPDYQAMQFRRRLLRSELQRPVDKKLQGRMMWISKMPFSYFVMNGNWGPDSLFTMVRDEKTGDVYSVKPHWA